MEILLSICVPSYNRSDLLKRLTKQLLDLKSDKFEFLFNDDCSTEQDVINHLNEISAKDSRLSIYHNKTNLGITKNYYSALRNAKGKYAMLLSNEDQIPHNFEKIVLPLLENNDYDAIYGFLQRPNKKDYAYKDEHPKETTNNLEFIKKNYAQIIFRGHISGQIYKKNVINFNLLDELSLLKNNYWPIAPITLMMMKGKNVLFIKDSLVIVGADCEPETIKSLKTHKRRKEINYLFSLEKRADLYTYYIKQIIDKNEWDEFFKVLARYFIFFSFRIKKTGISRLKDINSIKNHSEVGEFFNNELRKNYFKNYFQFYVACFNKYLNIIFNKIIG